MRKVPRLPSLEVLDTKGDSSLHEAGGERNLGPTKRPSGTPRREMDYRERGGSDATIPQ